MGDDLPDTIATSVPVRLALVASALAALGAAFAAGAHASASLVGWLAAGTAFAATFAAASRARDLRASDVLREPRMSHAPTAVEALPDDVTRRGVFDRFWGLAAGAVTLLAVVPFVALARAPRSNGTLWKAGTRLVTPDGMPLRVDDVAVGGVETVFPEGHLTSYESTTVLVRLPPTVAVEGQRSDWIRDGNIAYSKICTHAGCPVALYRQESLELYCPCHQSVFDVVDGARPVSGPATRALPQLALDVDDEGYLVARGDFDAPVGPDNWGRIA
jgi:ubiquinol-cytochrome c reductase iron-sulfur subunit